MAGESFFSDILKMFDTIFYSGESRVREHMGNSSWFVPHHQGERGSISGGVFSMIVDEFGHGKVLGPFGRSSVTIDPKISLKLLIEPFGLPIGLRVIGGG